MNVYRHRVDVRFTSSSSPPMAAFFFVKPDLNQREEVGYIAGERPGDERGAGYLGPIEVIDK